MVSFAQESLTGRSIVRVTHRMDWSATKSIGLDGPRWPTATFQQDSTGALGFNEERRRGAEAIGQHWYLVLVAYSLVYLMCPPAGPVRTQSRIQTIGDVCPQQGRVLVQRLWTFVHEQLFHDAPVDHVSEQLFAKQRMIVHV